MIHIFKCLLLGIHCLFTLTLIAKLNNNPKQVITTKEITIRDTIYVKQRIVTEDVVLLAKLINSEAKSEPLAGQIAVGNVVLNRQNKNSSECLKPSIKDIIYKKGQFDGVNTKYFNEKPSKNSIIAAIMTLNGSKTIPDNCYYYANECISTDTKWIAYLNDNYISKRINNHIFYYD